MVLSLGLAGCGPEWVYRTVLTNCLPVSPTDAERSACEEKAATRARADEQALNNLHSVSIAPVAPVEWWNETKRPAPWNTPISVPAEPALRASPAPMIPEGTTFAPGQCQATAYGYDLCR